MRQSKMRWDEVRKGNMNCFYSVGRWMTGNRLKLNNDKLEALLAGSHRRVSMWQDNHLRVGIHDISLKGHIKNLGVYTDATLSVVKHIGHISWAYLEIRRISSICHLLTTKATAQLMCSLSVGLLQPFAHWHQLWSDVQAAKSSKPCSEGCFSQQQTWAC